MILRMNSQRGGIATWVSGLVMAILALILITQYSLIKDYALAMTFQPTAEVTDITSTLSLTSAGERTFNASQPEIGTSSDFNSKCRSNEADSPILGCYTNQRIYLFSINNKKLDGIEDVTAAHELLHAVYERMSDAQKSDINVELERVYEVVKNKDLEERMDYYAKHEPGERENELHSIIGTEVEDVGPVLQEHYEKYFTDRQSIVERFKRVDSVFQDVQNRSSQLVKQLDDLADSIAVRKAEYERQNSQVEVDIQNYKNRTYSSQSEADNDYYAIQSAVNQLQNSASSINQEIARYEELYNQLTAVSSEAEALNRSIDSSLSPLPTVQ